MFDSVFSSGVTITSFLLMTLASVVSGAMFAFVMSFKIKSSKRFFSVISLLPFIVAVVVMFVNGNIGAGVAIGGAFALVRFRSRQGSADEIAAIFGSMVAGVVYGMGYLFFGVITLVVIALGYVIISLIPIFRHKNKNEEKILKITIPESLEYVDVFDSVFKKYLKEYERVGVKTTNMGSMYKLSYKIVLTKPENEKKFIDELRIRNGNLEIGIVPYVEEQNVL